MIFLLLLACKSPEDKVCTDLCDELVYTCRYDAFPSYDSCLQGCAYDGEQGANLEQEAECLAAAECDPFEVVNCQNRFGPEGANP